MVKDRDAFILEHLGLVRAIANRFKNRGIEYDDLYQAGCVGLVKAVDNFDRTLGYSFSTYAVPVIMGEIKRLFRDGSIIKTSRSLKDKAMIADKARQKFIQKFLREPSVCELAEACGFSREELCSALEVMSPVQSLNPIYDGECESLDIPYDTGDALFKRLLLSQAATVLSETEQKLIQLRFYKGMTQCETARLLGLSQVQVSRKEKTALLKLREHLK